MDVINGRRRKMKHDIEHLKDRWRKFKVWTKYNELKFMLIVFGIVIGIMTALMIGCPIGG